MGPFTSPETPTQVTLKEDTTRPGNSVWIYTSDALVKDGKEKSLSPIRPLRKVGTTPTGVVIVAYETAAPDADGVSTSYYVAAGGIAKTEAIVPPIIDCAPAVAAGVAAATAPLHVQINALRDDITAANANLSAATAALSGAEAKGKADEDARLRALLGI